MMQVRFDFAITLRICVLVLSIHGLWAQSYFPARIPYPLDQVNPFIGTGGHGHTFPGAVFPFGMMQLSPDTRLEGWDGCSGYHDTDSVIYGFSHTHLSGTGIPDYCDVLFMPGTGAVHFNNGSKGEPGYASAFKKSSEIASPGFYQVKLEKYGVTASLTTGKRSGMQAYRYARPGQQWLLIDLKHRDPLIAAGFTAQSKNHIAGYRHSRSWAKQQSLFFHARFNKDIRSISFSPDSLQLVLYFDSDAGTALLAHVGISAVDAEGAEKNLMSEWNEFRFADLLQQTQMEWKSLLSRVEVEDRDSENKKIFYTSLYHTLIHPSLFQDVDGRYRGMDQKIHTAIAEDHYTVFSLWDTYRSTHPLYQWIYPEYNAKFIRTFLRHYEQSGHLPVWELAGNETWCMIGNHAIPVIANAWAHGALDFDTSLARIAVSSSLLKGSQSGLTFMGKGFISSEEESESVSKTIENSLDFAAARAMGCMDVPSGGATAYRNLYHPRTGFFQAKQNNRFVTPFDPAEVNFHFTEANAWQYLFGAHHDLRGMNELFALDPGQQDGRSAFLMKLDSLFETGSEMTGRVQSDITGLIGQYAHGNEPSHHVAYLYAALGRPDKTQAYVERIRNEFYKNRPDGLIGNEDCGQMSSWYVFSALGFYPLHPFDAHYIAGIPAFEKTTIRLPGKDPVQIRWRRDGQSNQHYGLRINGVRSGSRFKLNPGDRLEFVPEAGGAIVQETETIAVNTLPPILPFVAEGQRSFADSTRVILSAPQNLPVEYTFDTSFKSGLRFQQPLVIREPLRIYFRLRSDGEPGSWLFADFAPRPKGFGLHLKSEYANAYAAGGPEALMDGLTGSRDFRDGLWQGYQGKDLDLELENQSGQIYQQVSIRFLQDQASWIMMPDEVRFEISDDGREFSLLGVAHHQVSKMTEGGVIQEFNMEINRPFRFIRILARNSGKLPEWHLGAGGTSWLFADEIRLK